MTEVANEGHQVMTPLGRVTVPVVNLVCCKSSCGFIILPEGERQRAETEARFSERDAVKASADCVSRRV